MSLKNVTKLTSHLLHVRVTQLLVPDRQLTDDVTHVEIRVGEGNHEAQSIQITNMQLWLFM